MARNYTVNIRIARPVEDVFGAVVSSERLCLYFSDTSSGDLTEGDRVIWHWDGSGDCPVIVTKVVPNELIQLSLNSRDWKKTDDSYDVAVIFEFEALENGDTMLSISEEGWKTDKAGLKASHENCGGWSHMATCLKAYIEHDIDLR
ncbi:MAG: SRPBCC domain-containing protein [Proteobacteria bacterium]|nr:SRPBCC domain-containing protein [Pseudomonadota bacterium]